MGKEMLGVGRGNAGDGNSNRVSGQIHISACKKKKPISKLLLSAGGTVAM